jgi:hypothetical protein
MNASLAAFNFSVLHPTCSALSPKTKTSAETAANYLVVAAALDPQQLMQAQHLACCCRYVANAVSETATYALPSGYQVAVWLLCLLVAAQGMVEPAVTSMLALLRAA